MARRLFRLLVVLSVIFVLGVAAVWVLTNTDFGRERVRKFALGALQGATHGIVRIGALHGNLLTGATLVDVSITDSAGRPFLAADSLSGRYVLRGFLSKRIYLDDLTLYHPRVVVEKLPGGEWNYRRLWPQQKPSGPVDTLPGWGSWVKFTNVTVLNGDVVVRSPWEPRTGLSARVRDSVITDALKGGSRLTIVRAPGGLQKVIELAQVNGKYPLVRIADPDFKNRLIQVSAMSTKAFPFRPPPADIRALTGNFEFNDDSLWWKGAGVRLPASNLRGDGMYNISNGDMRLTLAASPARFADFKWLYKDFPESGGGNLGLQVQWTGATQDYVIRNADVRTGSAHLLGDVGVTVADTVFFHDADVRFTGVTTKQIEDLVPGMKSPRQGVLSGSAKFAGTFKRLDLAAADITFDAYGRGRSHVLANGVIGVQGAQNVVSARNLRLRLAPLQVDLLKIIIPTMPIGGTLAGSLTLNGSGDTRLVMSKLDVVHQDGPNRSHATGTFAVHTTGRRAIDVDVIANPLALAELRKFVPSIPFIGQASGPVHAHGPIDALVVDTRLTLPGGGTFALDGTVDFLSKELGYDVRVASTDLNLSRVVSGTPVTSLTGGGTARGRGFKPATMYSELSFAFGPSSLDTIAVDSVNVQATLANGLAQVARAELRAHGASVAVNGAFGLDASHSGSLAYAVQVDSLGTLAPYIPALGADTGVVTPRPKLAAEILRRALADSARIDKQTEVARAISGAPPPRVQVDTPVAIPRGLVAGSLRAKGTIVGSLDRFTLQGDLSGTGIVARGNAARHIQATYSWVDAKTAHAKMNVALTADTVSVYGFAFDSVAADLSYAKPSGTVAVRIRQGNERDYALRGDFTLDNARNELRLADVSLRFDTTTWRTTHPAAIRWGGRGIEVVNLEMRSGPTQRLYANGLLPTSGPANFELAVTNFNVANIADLLQSDLQATGIVSFDAHVQGTAENPRVQGTLSLVDATYQGTAVPDISGTFNYADQRLAVNATAKDSTGRQLAQINGTIPINLALSGVTGSRLLDLPIDVALVSDSLPIDLIPKFTGAVTNVKGRALGDVHLRGTLKHPVLQGEVTLVDGAFTLAATGAKFTAVNGHVRMTGDSVFVDSVTALAGGPVRLTGTLGIGNWREPAFNLFLTAKDAVVLDDKRGKIYASAGLRISGPFDSTYVSGQVTVTHGVFYIPETTGKKLVAAGDPALFAVLDTSVASERDIFPAQSSLLKNLRVDVDLVVQRNTWVRSRDANVEIFTDGPMRVSVVGDALTLVGAVDADRGEYTFLSKRFQIKRGSALFIGSPDLNPTLQITAEYVVKQPTGATNIQVLIGGTLQNPRLSLTSDAQPPLSQSDLLSYLAFGSTTGSLLQFNQTSLTQGGNLINLAGARLAGVAIGEALNQVEGDAARSLGVDVFNVTPGDAPVLAGQSGITQFVTGTEIEAGKYLTPNTYATVIATPGAFVLNGSGLKVPPGVSLSHRTSKGYRFETSYGPRYILEAPTLSGQKVSGIGQFGVFVIREWRF
ncbi:MAG TPA: translocation/assembly module TamB domain-containing protein [Gemmatimonadaceae bacterium]|nr:translocation/assembly module TamB domain-containing protein [Gemmatimonadaceae bacterium]